MDREAFRDEVRENIKRTVAGVSNARVNRWCDWSQQLLADWHTYEEMRKVYTGATVDGQYRYGFPTRMKDIVSLVLRDGAESRKLEYVPWREFDLKVPRPATTTEEHSTIYVDYGVNFECYPIPDAAYTLILRSTIYPIPFAADSSVSALLNKDALISAVATMFGFLSLRELEDAQYWKEEVVKELYVASVESDHNATDWTPIARPFRGGVGGSMLGSYWLNPLIKRMP